MKTIKRVGQLSLALLLSLGILMLVGVALAYVPDETPSPASPPGEGITPPEPVLPFDLDFNPEDPTRQALLKKHQNFEPVPLHPVTAQSTGRLPSFDLSQTDALRLGPPGPLAAQQVSCDPAHEDYSQLVKNGDFEYDAHWQFYGFGPPGTPEPTYDPAMAYSGTQSIIMSGIYTSELVAEQIVVFPPRINQAVFSFHLHRDTDDPDDEMYVLLFGAPEDPYAELELLAWAPVTYTMGAWKLNEISLDPVLWLLSGREALVMFYAITDDYEPTTFHLDAVALELCAPIPPCQNQIVNGGFESYPHLDQWQSAGNVSPVYDHQVGNTSAKIGGGVQTLENPSFETGDWWPWQTYGLPELVTDTAYTGAWSAYLGGYDLADDQIWQVITIPVDATDVTFDFWYSLQTVELYSGADYFCALISDASTLDLLVLHCSDFGATGDLGWTQEIYSLSPTELVSVAGKTVNAGFIVQTDGSDPSAAWVDEAFLHIATNRASLLWQTFTFPDEGRTGVLNFQLGAVEQVNPADIFYVAIYSGTEKLEGWQPEYTPGFWEPQRFRFVSYPSWRNRDLDLVFFLNENASPDSIFFVDDVVLDVCPEVPNTANAFLRADVHATDGNFVIGTTGGDPDTANDDNRRLLYGFNVGGYSMPGTSFTTLRIVSGTKTLNIPLDIIPPADLPRLDEEGQAVVTRWFIKGIEIFQIIDLVENPFTRQEDTTLINYEIVNWNFDARQVGLRTLLDVKIGNNDGAPYFVPGYGPVIHEVDFPNPRLNEIPPYWKAFEGSPSDPFDPVYLKGQGILRAGVATPPDRFTIARWPTLYDTLWSYTITPTAVITKDSAVALYWEPVLLYHGQETRFATYYGLAGGGGGATWLDGPAEVTCDNLEFEVALWVHNRGSAPLVGGSSTLTLPAGIRLGHGISATLAREDILPDEAQPVGWVLAADERPTTATLTIEAVTTFDNAPAPFKPQPMQILVPGCTRPLLPPSNLSADPGSQSIELSWDPSTSPEVEGYNVYRSTSASGPFTKINTAIVQGTFYEDTDSSLTAETTYYYQVKSVANGGATESGPSNTASAAYGQLKLFIPNSYGPQGSIITVPVNIANASGLQIYEQEVWFSYPARALRPVAVRRTILTLSGYAFQAATRTLTETGQIRIDLLRQEDRPALYGDGTLFQVYFRVLSESGMGTLKLDKSRSEIFSQANQFEPLPLTLGDGAFQVRKNYILGDLNGDGQVTAEDADLALSIAVGKLTPTEEQQAAGDVNGDGRINSADAAIITRVAAGLATLPATALFGLEALSARAGEPVNVSIGSLSGLSPGQTFWVPIKVSVGATDPDQIAGGIFILNYNSNVLTPLGARLTSLTSGFDLETNLDTAGIVKLSLAYDQAQGGGGVPAGSSGTLVEVQFKVNQSAQDGSTPLTLARAQLNDPYSRDFATSALQKALSIGNGLITIGAGPTLDEFVYLPVVLKNR